MPLPVLAAAPAAAPSILSGLASVGGAVSNVLGKIPGIGGGLKRLTRVPSHKRAVGVGRDLLARIQQGDQAALAELTRLSQQAATKRGRAVYAQYLGQANAGNFSGAAPGGGGGGGGGGLGDLARYGLGAIGAIQGAQSAGRAEQYQRRGTTDIGNPYAGLRPIRGPRGQAEQAARGALGF